MAKLRTIRTGDIKSVSCTHCGAESQVAKRAMSVFCPHCHQRLILEDYKVKTYLATRLFATCGDIVVEKSGFVSAPIRVQNLTVRGQVQGNVEARGCVRIARTGQLKGDIRAPVLRVAAGAKLNGFFRILPKPEGQTGSESLPDTPD